MRSILQKNLKIVLGILILKKLINLMNLIKAVKAPYLNNYTFLRLKTFKNMRKILKKRLTQKKKRVKADESNLFTCNYFF